MSVFSFIVVSAPQIGVWAVVGAGAGVAREALDFSFGLACEGTAAEGAQLVVEDTDGQELDIVQMEIE